MLYSQQRIGQLLYRLKQLANRKPEPKTKPWVIGKTYKAQGNRFLLQKRGETQRKGRNYIWTLLINKSMLPYFSIHFPPTLSSGQWSSLGWCTPVSVLKPLVTVCPWGCAWLLVSCGGVGLKTLATVRPHVFCLVSTPRPPQPHLFSARITM